MNLIGQFGVGFYSAFMVAEKVEIVTKSHQDAPAAHWICDGSPEYTLEEADKKERDEVIAKLKKNPREYIAQPLETLSTAPTITENDIEPRHLDLRPFVLSGKTTYVSTGGLTRVALRKGSTIVNSSQGGGSKDTLIVDV